MKSSKVNAGDNATAKQYDDLRQDAYGGSQLLVHQQAVPGMTVHVENGAFFLGPTKVFFAGGNSPAFAAPGANPRIDILTIDSAGVLAITQGVENAAPVAPIYPINKLVLAEIYNVVGETVIYDKDNQVGGQGYITDTRPILYNPAPTITDNSGLSQNTNYTNTSGRFQLHIVTIYIQVGSNTPGDSGRVTVDFNIGGVAACEIMLYDQGYTQIQQEGTLVAMVKPGEVFNLRTFGSGTFVIGSIVTWKTITY